MSSDHPIELVICVDSPCVSADRPYTTPPEPHGGSTGRTRVAYIRDKFPLLVKAALMRSSSRYPENLQHGFGIIGQRIKLFFPRSNAHERSVRMRWDRDGRLVKAASNSKMVDLPRKWVPIYLPLGLCSDRINTKFGRYAYCTDSRVLVVVWHLSSTQATAGQNVLRFIGVIEGEGINLGRLPATTTSNLHFIFDWFYALRPSMELLGGVYVPRFRRFFH